MNKYNVGIFIFDDVEVLDFTGPFEVFSRTRTEKGPESRKNEINAPFKVFTVSKIIKSIIATGGLQITPSYSFKNAPLIDILIIPGGYGTRVIIKDDKVISWIKKISNHSTVTASVCTGSLLLGEAGLLTNKKATTHWSAMNELSKYRNVYVQKQYRIVDDGIITSAGVASGIDASFYIISKFFSKQIVNDTAKFMEYKLTNTFKNNFTSK